MNLNDLQKEILAESSRTRGYGGYAAKSCRRHLERAFKLRDSMPEVAVFLAITAEEESATAIFAALRKRNYRNIEKIKVWDHKYKAGVYQFLKLLEEVLGPLKHGLPLIMYFDSSYKEKKILRIRMPIGVEGDRQICVVPEPPLNLVSVDPGGKAKDYLRDVRSAASEKGIQSIFKYIQEIANQRNTMLYASVSSIPEVNDAGKFLNRHFEAVFLNLIIYLLIEPHKKQNLVQEALDVYIKILQRIDEKET